LGDKARSWSKQRQRASAESLLKKISKSTGHKPGSAIRPLPEGTSFQASIMACKVATS
jgi:hypothetical protein